MGKGLANARKKSTAVVSVAGPLREGNGSKIVYPSVLSHVQLHGLPNAQTAQMLSKHCWKLNRLKKIYVSQTTKGGFCKITEVGILPLVRRALCCTTLCPPVGSPGNSLLGK